MAGAEEITLDRRQDVGRRQDETGKASENPTKPTVERREKVSRRRQIDPTTCERDYSDQEVEFMNAMDEYKRTSGRMFPTCSEVLEVIRDLGYTQLNQAEIAARKPIHPAATDSVLAATDTTEELTEEEKTLSQELDCFAKEEGSLF